MKNVTEVRVARAAQHFNTGHTERLVLAQNHRIALGGGIETWPTAVTLELGVRSKKFGAARTAMVNTLGLGVDVLTVEGGFRRRLAEYRVLLGA